MEKFLLVLVSFISTQMFSQDLIGGYARASKVSAFNYSISVSIYTDASLNITRATIPVSFGDGTVGTLSLNLVQNANPTIVRVYSGLHNYAGAGQYLVSFLDTLRIAGIKNMINSQTRQMYLETMIVITNASGTNSAPSLIMQPLNLSVLKNQTFNYNASFSDVDGDSLSFSLINCSGTGYYIPPNASVGSSSGLFSLLKDTVGNYLFAYQVKEWRKNTGGIYTLLGTSQLEFVVQVKHPTALIENKNTAVNFLLYPNPASNELFVQLNEAIENINYIEISNFSGQTILRNTGVGRIDISTLPKGIYFLKISAEEKTTSRAKFIKD